MHNQKGFTIIELIVVIAIIAVLATIILVNVTGYIGKSENSAIKASMSSLLTNGTAYYEANNSFSGFIDDVSIGCAPTGVVSMEILDAGGFLSCNESADAWCACSPLNVTNDTPANSTFCVDSRGVKVVTEAPCATECQVSGSCL